MPLEVFSFVLHILTRTRGTSYIYGWKKRYEVIWRLRRTMRIFFLYFDTYIFIKSASMMQISWHLLNDIDATIKKRWSHSFIQQSFWIFVTYQALYSKWGLLENVIEHWRLILTQRLLNIFNLIQILASSLKHMLSLESNSDGHRDSFSLRWGSGTCP